MCVIIKRKLAIYFLYIFFIIIIINIILHIIRARLGPLREGEIFF